MKRINVFFTMAIALTFFSCIQNTASDSNIIKLSTNWHIISSAKIDVGGEKIASSDFNRENWYPTEVPTTVLAALVKNDVYSNPYYGLNLKSIPGYREGRWLAMQKDSPFYPSWWYRTEFKVPADFNRKNLVLHFDGINYQANIWLNGHQIADSAQVKGMFRRFEFDVNEWIKTGEKNVLAVEIIAPGHIADIPYRTKQLEATTGWDDHNPQPPDLNMGIWQKVYLTTNGAVMLRYPYVSTDLDLPSLDIAHLTVSAELTNVTEHTVSGDLIGKIENISFSKNVNLTAGESKIITFTPNEFSQLNITNPRLWWPNPVGPQNLYKMQLEFRIKDQISDKKMVRFGIREVSTYINDEGWRGYMVNGKKILIRGGAWMTSDMMLRLTTRRYEALIRFAHEANLNMLRSEGFSIRETDEFYNLCDEYGVMVTQQIFGRSIPDEKLAIDNVEDMLLRIRNHPSLVHFLGHDETFPTPTLDKAYRELIAKYTPERTYQPHSGAFEIKNRFETGGTRTGTHELWTYATPSHYYTHKEDGAWGFAQSGGIGGVIAPYESMKKNMPVKDLWPPYNETFSFHTVLQEIEYFNVVIDNMKIRYGEMTGIEDFCRKGQALNYESARGMYEAYGRNKYDALGLTTWKYNAAWPAVLTWQYVDWFLNVGGAYYGAKKACEPLHVQYSYDDQSVYVINNFYKSFEKLHVKAKIFNFDMTEKYSKKTVVSVSEDGKTEAFKIDLPNGLSTTYFLSLKLEDAAGKEISDNFYWHSTVADIEGTKKTVKEANGWWVLEKQPKSVADFTALKKLEKVHLQTSVDFETGESESTAKVSVHNPDSHLAFMIHLSVTRGKGGEEVLPSYWDDNYFSLLPGESKVIKAHFNNNDLQGSAAAIKVDGWNVH